MITFDKGKEAIGSTKSQTSSRLSHWPIQLSLTPPGAPFFADANLLIAADCVPFAYADFHQDFLKGKTVVIGCPKLDDINFYADRLAKIFENSNIKKVAVVHMEVPCCSGLNWATKKAIATSGKKIPLEEIVISTKGEKII